MRTLIDASPFPAVAEDQGEVPWWVDRRSWPCDWIAPSQAHEAPLVVCYRCLFSVAEARTLRIHCSADERYELWLDGTRIGQGPERCEQPSWSFESYDLDLSSGDHCLLLRAWSLDGLRPWAQAGFRQSMICAPESSADLPVLGSGVADWQARIAGEWSFLSQYEEEGAPSGMGPGFQLDASRQPVDWHLGGGDGWGPVTAVENGCARDLRVHKLRHLLRPAMLPPQDRRVLPVPRVAHVDREAPGSAVVFAESAHRADEAADWQSLLEGGEAVRLNSGSCRRVLLDLGAYACWLPELIAQGRDGRIDMVSAESPSDEHWARDRRDRFHGMQLRGLRDRFCCGEGPMGFQPLWWRAGRWLLLEIQAGSDEPLRVQGLRLDGVGYPLRVEANWAMADMAEAAIADTCLRTLRCCMHETFMDCPYYEQLQYVGDTRIQAQLVYALSRDDRLPRAALRHFNRSRNRVSGLTTSNHPAPSGQTIPPFSLWWISMIHDFLYWRGERNELCALMPGVRAVLETFLARRGADGLLRMPYGWNFCDGEGPGFRYGVPPGGEPDEVNATFSWQLIWTLGQAAELETFLGEREMAARWSRVADEMAARLHECCWVEDEHCYAEAPRGMRGHEARSQHCQLMALLSDRMPEGLRRRLVDIQLGSERAEDCGIMFSHYRFMLAVKEGRLEQVRVEWKRWRDALAQGFTTFPEHWQNTRSDCHAWSAHPLYHMLTGVAGIRPAAPGFTRALIAPQPSDGECIDVALPHPGGGAIGVQLTRDGERLFGSINLPEGVPATLHWRDQIRELAPGTHPVEIG